MTGYRRLQAQGVGVGAAELLRAILDCTHNEDPPQTVGSVHRVFDRSLYIEFTAELTHAVKMPGPRLMLIGDTSFSGPLSLRVAADRPRGFDPKEISTGTRCTLRTLTTGEATGTRVLTVGGVLEIEFETKLLEAMPVESAPTVPLQSIHPGSHIWRRAAAAVTDLIQSETVDGLGWIDYLEGVRESPETPAELDAVIEGCRIALDPGWEGYPPDAVRGLLGRGPGATPSGDDILAGVFLMLLRTTTGEANQRVRHAGETLVDVAEERTTSISTALLAQATRGRAADPIVDAREALLRSQVAADERRTALSNIRAIGHTSGVDTLVGMLLVLLYIGPAVATSE